MLSCLFQPMRGSVPETWQAWLPLCLIGTLNSLFQLRVPRQPKNNSGVEMKMAAANDQLKLSR